MTAATRYAAIVQKLIDLIDTNHWQDKFDAAIAMAGKYNIPSLKHIDSRVAYYDWVNDLYHWVPTETKDAKNVYNHICEFYFILDQAPVKGLQNKISPKNTNEPLTALSQWIVDFAGAWGEWMDTTDSITEESIRSFQTAPMYNMDEYMPPPSGYKTFNQMFARHVKPGMRPIAVIAYWYRPPTQPSSAAGRSTRTTLSTSRAARSPSNTWIGPWTSCCTAVPTATASRAACSCTPFNATDYHRLHVPVSGRVLEARVIQGLVYLDVEPSFCSRPRST